LTELTFSVIICTHNRSHYLTDCLTSVLEQQYPSERYEIIIVDNASTDNTRQLVATLRTEEKDSPCLQYVYEPRLGLNHARNTGAVAANGAILAYIDDDAVADPNWLAALAKAYKMSESDRVCIGGRVELWWEGGRPEWLPRELEGYYSGTRHLGNTMRQLKQGEYPIGANLSLPRALLLETGGFPAPLGRLGDSLLSNEEVSLCKRLIDIEARIFYAPEAVVYHRVPAARATQRWLLRRAHWQGISDVLLEEEFNESTRLALLRHSLGTLSHAMRDLSHIARAHLRADPAKALLYAVYLAGRLGRVRQQLTLAVHKKFCG
jgi:glycosyltransferase involved in cell wall biosynthesis